MLAFHKLIRLKMKRTFIGIFSFILIFIFISCKKSSKSAEIIKEETSNEVTIPLISTAEITNITTISAFSGGSTINNGGASITERGVCLSLSPNPTINDIKYGTLNVNGLGDFTSEIKNLKAATKYYVRAFGTNRAGTGYGNERQFSTQSIGNASFIFSPIYIIGSTLASCDIQVITDGGDAITERGICWSLSPNPTLEDNKIKDNQIGLGKFRSNIKGLLGRTTYHVRAYAINSKGISYSDNVEFKTIGKGNITYTFNKAQSPTTEQLAAYSRLQIAIDSAVWYLENYTSATKHVYLNYVEGVATADANNEGWMRFGTNSGFHNIRTMLHEINHTLGTGTTTWWNNQLSNGKFQGTHTTDILRKIQNDPEAKLSGDAQHWWPYGLNQNSEVTSSWDYVYNCIIIEAMRKDGLPPSISGTYIP